MACSIDRNVDFDGDPPIKTTKMDEDLELFVTIDQATKSWLNSLHHVWSLWKKSAGVTQTLYEYFETAPNPYFSTLRILVNINDFYHIKTKSSLSFTVIEEFVKWITPKKDLHKECLVPDLKIAAFRLVSKQKNVQLMKIVSQVYEFSANNRLFIGFINKLIEDKKFKEAGQFVEMLNLQESFADPEVLLLPLILQNKVTIAEDILKNQPDMQLAFVSYLDNLLAPEKNLFVIMDNFVNDNNIPDVKMSTVHHKPLSKLVARLAKLYNLPTEACPFLHKKRGEGALQFLVYKRYIDGTLSVDSFREMAKEAIGADSALQVDVLKSLCNANDPAEAMYFALTYDVPKEDWPYHLLNYENNVPKSTNERKLDDSINNENWDVEDIKMYHTLKLPRERIHIIDNSKSFENFLDLGLKNVNIIGIDSEWKPSFSIKKPELALIQIATENDVYILDVTTLGSNFEHLWTNLGTVLFNNRKITKLGFGIAHDIAVIKESLPTLSNIRSCGEGYLDLSHLWKRLLREENFSFPFRGDKHFTNENLSKLVELCLGQRLNKSDQFSNWERRPLREDQILYAALDAYCLIEVYKVLSDQCDRVGIPFQDIVNHMHLPSNNSTNINAPKSSKKKARKSHHYSKNNFTNMQYQDVRSTTPQYSQNSHYQNGGSHEDYQNYEPENNVHKKNFGHVVEHDRNTWQPPMNIHSWKNGSGRSRWTVQSSPGFVCDSMLVGLSKQLRKCGLDCLHFDYDRGGDHSFFAANNYKRILLTRNGNFERFNQYLPVGYCYKVMQTKAEDQLTEILSHFNIEITEADIFSRCQTCNTNEFVFASKDTMALLFQRFGRNFHPHAGPSTNNLNDRFNIWDNANKARQIFDNDKQFFCRNWRMYYGTLDMMTCSTKYNAKVQIDQVPANVLQYVKRFHICEGCGKIYWYGSHMERALNGSLKNVLTYNV